MSAPSGFIRWLLSIWLLSAGLAHAQGFQSTNVDCANLKLQDASGAGDPNAMLHKYDFSGSCRLYIKGDGYTHDVKTFPVVAKGIWDAKNKQFDERVRITGAFKWDGKVIGGELTSSFKCNDDPLAAQAACNGFDHKNKTALEALSNPYKQQGRPLLVGHTTPAQVLNLASKHPKTPQGKQAEVPPPKKKPSVPDPPVTSRSHRTLN